MADDLDDFTAQLNSADNGGAEAKAQEPAATEAGQVQAQNAGNAEQAAQAAQQAQMQAQMA